MRILWQTLVIVILALVSVSYTFGQETLWNELNLELAELYRQGKYQEATEVAQRAVKVSEKTFGPNHPRVATSQNNLATLYITQGR
jgi:hypothetical protein